MNEEKLIATIQDLYNLVVSKANRGVSDDFLQSFLYTRGISSISLSEFKLIHNLNIPWISYGLDLPLLLIKYVDWHTTKIDDLKNFLCEKFDRQSIWEWIIQNNQNEKKLTTQELMHLSKKAQFFPVMQ